MNQPLDIETRRRRNEMAIKAIGLCAVAVFVSPFVFILIKGLIGMFVAAGVAFVGLSITPLLARKFANWRLKAIKAEAEANPIETLEIELNNRRQAKQRMEEIINKFAGMVGTLADKFQESRSKYPQDLKDPNSALSKMGTQIEKMRQVLALRRKQFQTVCQKVDEFAEEIEKAGSLWELAQAAAEANAAAGVSSSDFLQEISVKTALNTVKVSMNSAFAELETDLAQESALSDRQTQSRIGSLELNEETVKLNH